MELDFWCEVAWLKLGEQQLPAGKHKLEIRLPKTKDDKGKPARILFACDALCLSAGPFSPNSQVQARRGRARRPRTARRPRHVFAAARAGPAAAARVRALEGPVGGLPPRRAAARRGGRADHGLARQQPHWTAIDGARRQEHAAARPGFAHRLWYRTRVNVPASLRGPVVLSRLPAEQPEHHRLRQRRLCGFDKNPFARVPDRRHQGHQAGRERDLGRHPRRLVRLLGQPDQPDEAAQDVQPAAEVLAATASRTWPIRSGTTSSRASWSRRSSSSPGRSTRPTSSASRRSRRRNWPLEVTLKQPDRPGRRGRSASARPSTPRPARWRRRFAPQAVHAGRRRRADARSSPSRGRTRSSGGPTSRTCTGCAPR